MRRTILLIAALASISAALHAQEIDRLVAAVNGKVVTELDLSIAGTLKAVLQFGRSADSLPRQQELEDLIQQELIRQEMDNFPISESDRAQVEETVEANLEDLRNAYAEIGGLPALLERLGLAREELVTSIRTIVLSEKFINLRFGPFITVTDAEVEEYYRRKLPEWQQKGNAPSLAGFADQIRMILREEKKTEAWYKWIENVRMHSRIEYFGGEALQPTEKDAMNAKIHSTRYDRRPTRSVGPGHLRVLRGSNLYEVSGEPF